MWCGCWLLRLSVVIPPSVVRTSILGDASVRRAAAMAPKPGVNLFRYALCMITTGVFDVKSNIPPAWRPNLRQPYTAYAVSSFFYTAVGIAPCGRAAQDASATSPFRTPRQRRIQLRAAASLGRPRQIGMIWAALSAAPSLQPSERRPRPAPQPPHAAARAPPPASRRSRPDRRCGRRRVAGLVTLCQIYLCPLAAPPGWPVRYATTEAVLICLQVPFAPASVSVPAPAPVSASPHHS